RSRVLALSVVSAIAAAAQALTPAERTTNIESFEQVWKTVRDKHWDPKLNGLDWQAVHDELRPKLEAAKDKDAARLVLNDMLDRLKQTHFGVFPGDVYHDLETRGDGTSDTPDSDEAGPGIDLRVLDGRAIVVSVDPDSPAAAEKVKPGW